MPTLRQLVRFRNRMVRLYWDADDAILYRILQGNLNDFEVFIGHVLDFTQ